MDSLSLFGLVAVTAMMLCDTFEDRSHWFTLGLSLSCVGASCYGFLQGAWPFGLVEGIWSTLAFGRWVIHYRRVLTEAGRSGPGSSTGAK